MTVDKSALINLITKLVLEEIKKSGRSQGKSNASELPKSLTNIDKDKLIPVGISNRHVHLSQEHVEILFGSGAKLTKFKDLSQPGQYACQEMLTLVGPKGVLEKVRVLGPTRKQTQVEVALSDCFKLGIKAPIRDSGDVKGSASLTLVGPQGSITISEGTIIASRHIHMHTSEAAWLSLRDGQRVSVRAHGPRSVTYAEVLVRVSDQFNLEMHVDMDEANAVGLKNGDLVELLG
ncbi:Propanediol utilization protein [Desulforamulus reducens MI-1]|uniref:Phosphate propanoyltransferase n=1 Tax=Desulforamulus reducens (strain ATCC BAA-1160 / DSM 100696 / MI-1) TaxID=349161 RepID=A4J437_DESRM|nr:phosphate propanoyltransferase [Desulforamulus reducens]ABO49840.1 Propanediol utilization protein [Desulforamulus reducens MI-1]